MKKHQSLEDKNLGNLRETCMGLGFGFVDVILFSSCSGAKFVPRKVERRHVWLGIRVDDGS